MITPYLFPIINDKFQNLPLILVTSGADTSPTTNRPTGIEDHQILFTTEGSGYAKTDKDKYIILPSSVYYLAPYTMQNYHPVTHPWETIYVTYKQSQFINFFNFENGVYSLFDQQPFLDILNEIMSLPKDANYMEKSSVLLYKLLLRFMFDISNTSLRHNNDVLHKAHNYILNHFREPIELNYLAS